jgi:hypothetical protein
VGIAHDQERSQRFVIFDYFFSAFAIREKIWCLLSSVARRRIIRRLLDARNGYAFVSAAGCWPHHHHAENIVLKTLMFDYFSVQVAMKQRYRSSTIHSMESQEWQEIHRQFNLRFPKMAMPQMKMRWDLIQKRTRLSLFHSHSLLERRLSMFVKQASRPTIW